MGSRQERQPATGHDSALSSLVLLRSFLDRPADPIALERMPLPAIAVMNDGELVVLLQVSRRLQEAGRER